MSAPDTVTVWSRTALLGVYTLTPTHCGTGQLGGAVDLPVARDASTGFPVLPATGLKGVLRDYSKGLLSDKTIDTLFGKRLDDRTADTLAAGRLAFTEGRLLAYPVRSLNRPFLHATCPLILERLVRDLRAVGRGDLLGDWRLPGFRDRRVLVADATLAGGTLVLEDLAYGPEEAIPWEGLKVLTEALKRLLPDGEQETRTRLAAGLAVVPDADFQELMQRVIPVQARVRLTEGKTTDKYERPDGSIDDSGNLWYEEHLPPDCLFLALIGERRRRGGEAGGNDDATLEDLLKQADALRVVQLGGNETVGQGLCLTTLVAPPGGGARRVAADWKIPVEWAAPGGGEQRP